MGDNLPAEEMADAGIRHSDVDGFTVVERKGRRPKIHLLRPWNECNTERGKSGADTIRVEGGTEQLALELSRLGYQRGGVACRRCFPRPDDADALTPVEEFAGEEEAETVNRRETLGSEVL